MGRRTGHVSPNPPPRVAPLTFTVEPMRPGNYTWRHDASNRVRVHFSLQPNKKLDVAVWWNKDSGPHNLLLWVPLHDSFVELGDLTGNQYGTPLHRIGLGTFVVNTAIQVLQAIYAPLVRVTGILSNPSDDYLPSDLREQLAEDRRMFWAQFGLAISPGHCEKLNGTVGALRPVTSGLVSGQFSRFVPLSKFTYDGEL